MLRVVAMNARFNDAQSTVITEFDRLMQFNRQADFAVHLLTRNHDARGSGSLETYMDTSGRQGDFRLALFTAETWTQFLATDRTLMGFRSPSPFARKRMTLPALNDTLICYVTKLQLWVGALVVTGRSDDARQIWTMESFPERFAVLPRVVLPLETGVPTSQLEGKITLYRSVDGIATLRGFLRASLNRFPARSDGEAILAAMMAAERRTHVSGASPDLNRRTRGSGG